MTATKGYTMISQALLLCGLFITVTSHGILREYEIDREKRNTVEESTSCKEKFKRIAGHSACLTKSPEVQQSGISEAEKQQIVTMHNDYRSKVSPAAANMLKMSWDDEIAAIAQGWAQNCDYTHDEGPHRTIPGRFSVGQNLARGYKDWETAINAWYFEKDSFTFGNKAANNFLTTGHYTQMVWALSSRIGCAYADCSSVRKYYVCNYGPAGNIGDFSKPYLTGASTCGQRFRKNKLCASLRAELFYKYRKNYDDVSRQHGRHGNYSRERSTKLLQSYSRSKYYQDDVCLQRGGHECDKDCLNGGTRDLSTCTCTCLKKLPYYIGEQCDLNCSAVANNQPYYCGKKGFDAAGCSKFENVPYHCPDTCDICPWGGIDYQEKEDNGAGRVESSLLVGLASGIVFMLQTVYT